MLLIALHTNFQLLPGNLRSLTTFPPSAVGSEYAPCAVTNAGRSRSVREAPEEASVNSSQCSQPKVGSHYLFCTEAKAEGSGELKHMPVFFSEIIH